MRFFPGFWYQDRYGGRWKCISSTITGVILGFFKDGEWQYSIPADIAIWQYGPFDDLLDSDL